MQLNSANLPVTDADPFAEGYDVASAHGWRCDNPYPVRSAEYHLWDKGFVVRASAPHNNLDAAHLLQEIGS